MKLLRPVGLFAAAVLLAIPAPAQVSSAYYLQQRGMDERFRIDLGGFFQNYETTVHVGDAQGNPGTDVSLEDILGQASSQTNFFANGYWRFGHRGSLQFAYRHGNRTSSSTINREIDFGDTIYHVGATLDSQFRFDVGEVYYAYSLVNNGDAEFALMLGVSAYFTKSSLGLSASVSGGGGGASGSLESETKSFVAPIPALGAYFKYTLYPRVFVWGKIRGLTATISGYHGSMLDWSAGFDWYFTKNVGIGGGYEYVKITFDRQETRQYGLTFTYDGPTAYLTLAF